MDDSTKGHRTFAEFLDTAGVRIFSVYIMRDGDGQVLYVGMTNSLHHRLKQHYVEKGWIGEVAHIDTIYGLTAEEAKDKESELIRELRPKHNVAGTVEEDGGAHLEKMLEEDEEFRRVWETNRAMRELGMLILEKRLERGLSQRELADRIGTSQNRIYLLESGEANPTLDTLQRLSAVLGFTLEIRPRELVAG